MFAQCVFRAAEDQFRAVRRQSLSGRRPGGAMERRAPMAAWMRARGVRVLLARLRVPSATVWHKKRSCECSSEVFRLSVTPHALRGSFALVLCACAATQASSDMACCVRDRCFVCM